MKVQTQTMIIISICGLIFLTFLYFFIQPSLLQEADSFDKTNVETNIHRVHNFTEIERKNLNRLNKDWASWDDTYTFVQDRNEKYIQSNLTNGTFVNNQLNYMVFFNGERETVFAKGYNFLDEKDLEVNPELTAALMSIIEKSPEKNFSFLLSVGSEPTIFSVRSVLRSDGSGVPVGKLVMGRTVNENYISEMGEALSLNLSMNRMAESFGKNEIEIVDDQIIRGNIDLSDYYGRPLLQVSLLQERSFFLEKKQSINQLIWNIFGAIVILTVILLVVFRAMFVSPLLALGKQMNDIRFGDNFTARLHLTRRKSGEISELEDSINTMLHKLEFTHGEVLKLAYHDQLTTLSNRSHLYQQFNSFVERHSSHVAVWFFDLDGFKRVNDTWGHSIGDSLLQHVAVRLKKSFSMEDAVLARIGGDEFVVVTAYKDKEQLKEKAEEVIGKINHEYSFGTVKTHISTSIGISLYPENGKQFESLLKYADIAMYEAKMKGKNQYFFYDWISSKSKYLELLAMKNDLIYAMGKNEFSLVYQPIHHAETNEISMVEALLRWQHPTQGLITPDKFVPILEETGLINEVGTWVLEESLKQVKKWHKAGHDSLSLSVNFSKKQLKEKETFLEHLDHLLKKYNFPAELLQIEITESDIAFFDDEIINFVEELHSRSVKVALDDFGVGASSLYGLRDVPVDIIKIDRSFINRIPEESFDASLLVGLYQILNQLNIDVITEGIETVDQLNFVMEHSKSKLQGYYLNKPKRSEEMDEEFFKIYLSDIS